MSRDLKKELNEKLAEFFKNELELKGIDDPFKKEAFVSQLIISINVVMGDQKIATEKVADPLESFDPRRAAVCCRDRKDFEEACWLVFLAIHFGENDGGKWGLLQAVYTKFGRKAHWTWERVSQSPGELVKWIDNNQVELKKKGSFGNHRKRESLSIKRTGRTIETYRTWFQSLNLWEDSSLSPTERFDVLYQSMRQVYRFGRLARFEYLCMLGKLGILAVEPDAPYLQGATGPLEGARLLFYGDDRSGTPKQLNLWLKNLGEDLGDSLGEAFGMQVLEDALCNWQKNPTKMIELACGESWNGCGWGRPSGSC